MNNQGLTYRMGEAERGMVLCGFGTGGIEVGTDGAFHHPSFHNNFVESREIKRMAPGSFFAVRAKTPRRTVCKMLQSYSPYSVPGISGLSYRGHFPFVDIVYEDDDLPVRLSLEAFCPFAAFDAKHSALPVVIFTFNLGNPTDETIEASVAFSWNNDIGITAKWGIFGNANQSKSAAGLTGLLMTTTRKDSVRGDQYAVVLIEDDAVKPSVLPSWNGSGRGEEFWTPFSETGDLPEEAAGGDTGALAARVELEPGGEKQVRFILAWYMPNHRDSGGTFRGHMYCNWFDGAWDVAEYAADRVARLREKSLEWQSLIYDSSLPDWLKETLVNNTYILPRASWWTKDDTFMLFEALSCCTTNPPALWYYDFHPLIQMFPGLSPKRQELLARYQLETGEVPTFCGRDSLDEPTYRSFRPMNSTAYAIACYMDYLWAGGRPLLERTYESARSAIRLSMTFDTDGDRLPNVNGAHDQAWDTWPMFGTAVYVCQFWLVALRAGEEMARVMGDSEFERECREWFDTARKNYEDQLWNGEYYSLYRDSRWGDYSSTCFLGQFFGQVIANLLGLGDLFPREHIIKGLQSINRLNVADSPYGATTGVKPDGRRDVTSTSNAQSCCLTPCEIFEYAAACIQAGLADIGMNAARKICEFMAYKKKAPWHSLLLMYPDTGELFYGTHYIDDLTVWSILPAVLGLSFDVANRAMTIRPNIIPVKAPVFSAMFYGMAEYRETRDGGLLTAELKLDNRRDAAAELQQLATRFDGASVASVEIVGPGGERRAVSEYDLDAGTLRIKERLVLDPGTSLLVMKGRPRTTP